MNGDKDYTEEDMLMQRELEDLGLLPHRFWNCNVCGAQNSELDGECQSCECGGKDCKRDNCSGPHHPDL